jgi:hypothetical protein
MGISKIELRMKLKNKYIIGVHVMFYEIEMLPEYIDSCIGMMKGIENPENVMYHFTWNTSEYFEGIDTSMISKEDLDKKFYDEAFRLQRESGALSLIDTRDSNNPVYNIADYRRDLNYKFCTQVDFVLWGETDSLWPRETFEIIEQVNEYAASNNINKYVLFFSERKMWDPSWKVIEHNDFTNVEFIDSNEWALENLASSKSYMTLQQMYDINDKAEQLDIKILNNPKFDGSCLVIKSDLIKSGVNIPQSLLCSGEDTSLADMAKLLLGDKFVQFVIKNILRVHNRRHPRKRLYISNENNPRGFCGNAKGDWWTILEQMSKHNLGTLRHQAATYTMEDVLTKINQNK